MKNLHIIFISLMLSLSISVMAKKHYKCYYKLIYPIEGGTVYEDSLFRIAITGLETFSFTLKNKTMHPLFVDWEKSSMVVGGQALRCIHSGIKYNEKANVQSATVVPPTASISDVMVPADFIKWDTFLNNGKWVVRPLVFFNRDRDFPMVKDEHIVGQSGNQYTVMLALEINGKQEYKTFTIEVFDFVENVD